MGIATHLKRYSIILWKATPYARMLKEQSRYSQIYTQFINHFEKMHIADENYLDLRRILRRRIIKHITIIIGMSSLIAGFALYYPLEPTVQLFLIISVLAIPWEYMRYAIYDVKKELQSFLSNLG